MPKLVLKRPIAKPGKAQSLTSGGRIMDKAPVGLKPSSLKVFDIPIAMLVEHGENPNVQTEKVFDEIVDKIRRQGFDEPIIVVPEVVKLKPTGKYLIVSGHHRKKAAVTLGMTALPAVIREGWSEDQVLVELMARNSLGGSMDPFKFTEAFDKLKKRYDPEQIKKMVGLTEKKAFDALYKKVKDALPAKAKKKLEEAKEDIKSIEDLTGILHQIFKEHGSELDYGMMVFSHGGKEHHYIRISTSTNKTIKALKKQIEDNDLTADDVFAEIFKGDFGNVIKKVKDAKAPSQSE